MDQDVHNRFPRVQPSTGMRQVEEKGMDTVWGICFGFWHPNPGCTGGGQTWPGWLWLKIAGKILCTLFLEKNFSL